MNYFRGASGALAVADLTRSETIDKLRLICKRFLSVNPQTALVTIGNKLDLFRDDETVHANLKKLAADYASEVILTSAKSGHGVEAAFISLSHRIHVPDE